MNRLTGRKEDGHAYVIGCPEFKVPQKVNILLQSIADKCADIEDILEDTYDLDRLRELVEADKDGRCVVLPCKEGDIVYKLGASICKWREIEHCDEYCDGWQYRDCWEGTRTVLEEKFSLCDIESVGKNIFFNREAAEAALAKEATHE